MFFILCDNWKKLLSTKIHRYTEIFLNVMLLFSLKPVFWKKSLFYASLSPQQQFNGNIKIKLIKFRNFLLIFVTNFTFMAVPDFSLQLNFFFTNYIFLHKLKTFLEACFL